MNQKGFVLSLILLLVAFGLAWYYESRLVSSRAITSPTESTTVDVGSVNPPHLASTSTGLDWQTYENSKLRFAIQYPSTWKIDEQNGITPDAVEVIPSEVITDSIVESVDSDVSIEPGSCENGYASSRAQTSTVIINGIRMEKIETNLFDESSTGRFAVFLFSGNSSYGWDAQCNTIRLYVPPVNALLGNTSKARQYIQDKAIEDQILTSFMFVP